MSIGTKKMQSAAHLTSTRRALTLAAALGLALPAVSMGQVNGTWTAIGGGNWSTSTNWAGGNIPDAGGIATLPEVFGQTGAVTYTVDTTSRTLSEVRFDTGWLTTSAAIAASGGAVINMPGSGGLTINSISSLSSSPAAFYTTPNLISAPIAGTGILSKIGPGNSALSSTTSTFTGDINVNAGSLYVTSGNNASLGNTTNVVNIGNGATFGFSAAAFSGSRTVNIPSGNSGTIRLFAGATFTGANNLTGAGTLIKGSGSALVYQAANSFTGNVRVDAGVVTFNSAGALASAPGSFVELPNQINLDSSTTNVNNRLGGRDVITRGGDLVLTGNASAPTIETLGALTATTGQTFLTITPNAAQPATYNFASLNRANRATLFMRGANFGNASGPQVATMTFATAPTLVGGGGAVGSTTTASIIPWVWGNNSLTNAATGSSFVTYESGRAQLIPTAGYVASVAASANVNDNVNVAVSEVIAANKTINALRINNLNPSSVVPITIDGPGKISLTSGAVLNSSSSATAPPVTVNAPLDAGSAEMVITSNVGTVTATQLIFNGVLSGTNGLTRNGPGQVRIGGVANDYTGTTTFNGGTTIIAGSTIGNAPSALGAGGDIVLNGSGGTVRLWTDGPTVFNRNIVANLSHSATLGLGTAAVGTTDQLVINGTLTLDNSTNSFTNRFLNLEAGDSLGTDAAVINGLVQGTGGLRGTFATSVVLNRANTYSGGTIIGGSGLGNGVASPNTQLIGEVWQANADGAFGTGPIWFSNVASGTTGMGAVNITGALNSGGSGTRTLANDIQLAFGLGRFSGTTPLVLNGNLDMNGSASGAAVLTFETGSNVTLAGSLNRGNFVKHGPGTLTLAGSNGYSGITIIREGTLSVNAIGNGLAASGNLSKAPGTAGYLLLSGVSSTKLGTLKYTGGGETTTRIVRIDGTGGVLDASGTGAVTFAGDIESPLLLGGFTGASVNITAGAIAINSLFTGRVIEGSTINNTTTAGNIPSGTTITESGTNFLRLSANATNASALTGQSLSITPPASFTVRPITLSGTNTGLNTISGVIQPAAGFNTSIIKSGVGTWNLTGANLYAGGTSVNGGLLLINNISGSGTGSGAVRVNNGGTLGGNGTIAGNILVNSGGTLAPGNSPGVLTSQGTLTMDPGSTFAAELTGTVAGTGYDQHRLTGSTSTYALNTGGGAPILSFPVTAGSYTLGDFFAIVRNDLGTPGTGNFAGLPTSGSIVSALTGFGGVPWWEIYYNADVDGTGALISTSGGNDIVIVAVPEPTTIAAVGALGLVALRRRRAK
jgi:fibronectin-binding autotransporter adhesin